MTAPLRVAIVDDEPLAHDRLQEFIEKIPHKLTLVTNLYSPDEASDYLDTYGNVDLLLMDIDFSANNTGQEGLKFAKWTKNNPNMPLIIFVSAHSEHCAKALDLPIVDFLTKPTAFSRFDMAIDRAIAQFQYKNPQKDYLLILHTKGGIKQYVKVDYRRIVYAESYSNYVRIYVIGEPKAFMVTSTLSNFVKQLPKEQFQRCHNSFVVGGRHIRSWTNKGIQLINEINIPIGDKYKDTFFDWLGEHWL